MNEDLYLQMLDEQAKALMDDMLDVVAERIPDPAVGHGTEVILNALSMFISGLMHNDGRAEYRTALRHTSGVTFVMMAQLLEEENNDE